jgi:ribonuclease Z
LSLAEDFMVWNVTEDDIRVRMAAVEEHTWAPPLASPAVPPKLEDRKKYAEMKDLPLDALEFSDFTKSGFWDVDDVLRPIYKEAGEAVGREFPYPGDE